MKTPIQLAGFDEAFSEQVGNFTKLPKISAPYTSVLKRATVTDFSADGLPKMGVERIMTSQIVEVVGETDANGLRVFKPINDVHDAVRFVGNIASQNDAYGVRSTLASTTDFVEITFYGTGLNLLCALYTTSFTFSYACDGGSPTVFFTTTTASNILADGLRKYAANQTVNVISGLTLGMHTVRLSTSVGQLPMYGFEILNTSGTSPNTLQLPPAQSYAGGKKLVKSALSVDSYNTNFESGTLGTKGGRVVVYQKADGTVAKAVTPTDATALYYPSASHTNETLIRSYNWREFGAGRADDFSNFNSSSSTQLAFTLDDGTTTLIGKDVRFQNINGYLNGSGSGSAFTTFTFVGTGLDVSLFTDSGSTHSFSVDGASAVTIPANIGSTTTPIITKIASGLPYGTHTVKFISGAGNINFTNFLVYGPSKPSIPSGSVELSDYYVMADYVATATATNGFVGQGVLRKQNTRENIYTGTWLGPTLDIPNENSGFWVRTLTATSYAQITFYGTGVVLSGVYAGSVVANSTVTIDGSSNLSGFTTSFIQSSTGVTWTPATGAIGGTSAVTGYGKLSISGLSLGLHTLRVTQNTTTDTCYVGAIDIITPIHSPKFKQNGSIESALPVGSCGIGDSRQFGAEAVPAQASGIGIVVPGSTAGLVSANGVPGRTDGSAVPASYIGQVITGSGFREWITPFSGSPGFSLNLGGSGQQSITKGVWLITGYVTVTTTSGTYNFSSFVLSTDTADGWSPSSNLMTLLGVGGNFDMLATPASATTQTGWFTGVCNLSADQPNVGGKILMSGLSSHVGSVICNWKATRIA